MSEVAVAVGGGVWLAAPVVEAAWRALRAEAERQRINGRDVRSDVATAIEVLREQAQQNLMSVRPTGAGPGADMAARSVSAVIPTATAAGLLGVSPRHLRRLVAVAGVTPIARDRWHRADIETLVATRRTA